MINYWDSSGLTIYLTKNIRPNNAGVLWLGNSYIEIPPRQEEVVVKGSFTPRCTNMYVKKAVLFVEMLNHMHYLGRAAHTDHIRNSSLLGRLGNEPDFNYDNPVLHKITPHVEFRAGDELNIYCHFTSADTATYTYYGEGTSDEMCFGFLTYYPEDGMASPMGTSWGDTDICTFAPSVITDGCETSRFSNFSTGVAAQVFAPVVRECRATYCRPGCSEVVAEAKKHVCMQGRVGFIGLLVLATVPDGPYTNLLAKYRSCEPQERCSNPAPRFPAPKQVSETCDFDRFMNTSSGALEQAFAPLMLAYQAACLPGRCRHGCKDIIQKIREHPCFHDEAGQMMDLQVALMSRGMYKSIYAMLHNCDAELLCDHPDAYAHTTAHYVAVNAATVPKSMFCTTMFWAMAALIRAFVNRH